MSSIDRKFSWSKQTEGEHHACTEKMVTYDALESSFAAHSHQLLAFVQVIGIYALVIGHARIMEVFCQEIQDSDLMVSSIGFQGTQKIFFSCFNYALHERLEKEQEHSA